MEITPTAPQHESAWDPIVRELIHRGLAIRPGNIKKLDTSNVDQILGALSAEAARSDLPRRNIGLKVCYWRATEDQKVCYPTFMLFKEEGWQRPLPLELGLSLTYLQMANRMEPLLAITCLDGENFIGKVIGVWEASEIESCSVEHLRQRMAKCMERTNPKEQLEQLTLFRGVSFAEYSEWNLSGIASLSRVHTLRLRYQLALHAKLVGMGGQEAPDQVDFRALFDQMRQTLEPAYLLLTAFRIVTERVKLLPMVVRRAFRSGVISESDVKKLPPLLDEDCMCLEQWTKLPQSQLLPPEAIENVNLWLVAYRLKRLAIDEEPITQDNYLLGESVRKIQGLQRGLREFLSPQRAAGLAALCEKLCEPLEETCGKLSIDASFITALATSSVGGARKAGLNIDRRPDEEPYGGKRSRD